MNIPSPRAHRKARIEIIPLIDIIFFLLATFVMVSLAMIKNKGVAVTLPAAATTAAQELPEFVTLSITKDGALFVDKEPIVVADLPRKLAALKAAASDDPRVLIQGDEEAKLGLAITVMDECRRLGIFKVTFRTRPKS